MEIHALLFRLAILIRLVLCQVNYAKLISMFHVKQTIQSDDIFEKNIFVGFIKSFLFEI